MRWCLLTLAVCNWYLYFSGHINSWCWCCGVIFCVTTQPLVSWSARFACQWRLTVCSSLRVVMSLLECLIYRKVLRRIMQSDFWVIAAITRCDFRFRVIAAVLFVSLQVASMVKYLFEWNAHCNGVCKQLSVVRIIMVSDVTVLKYC